MAKRGVIARARSTRSNLKATRDFLLEIGCEELPADYMPAILDLVEEGPALAGGLASSAGVVLSTKGAVWKRIQSFGTPRRLVLYVEGLEPKVQKEEKGPPVRIAYDAQGHPTKAAEAFAQRHGVHVSQLASRDTPKGPVLVATHVVPIQKVLEEAVPEILKRIVVPKKMRWDNSGVYFARPIRWLLSIHDSHLIPCAYGNVKASNKTFGTRRSGKAFTVSSWKRYSEFIRSQGIQLEQGLGIRLVDPSGPDTYAFEASEHSKREALRKMLRVAAQKTGGQLPDENSEEFQWLLSTLTFLAENPVIQTGSFRTEYLDLPPEVLATAMAKHLKLFSLFTPDGKKLLPRFLAVLEGKPARPPLVMANIERILEARFSDARFFFREDVRTPLEAKAQELAKVVFHEKLGSVGERIPRVERLIKEIAESCHLPAEVAQHAPRAARLAKADLVTQMVREFPSLQGVIGGRYAGLSGEPGVVARAIAEQYRPRAGVDPVPATPLGAVLSLADRVDTLAGYFGVGLKPTGSADPYGLRRQALGLVRILIEPPEGSSFVGLSFDRLFGESIQSWGARIAVDSETVKKDLQSFLRERFQWLSERMLRAQPEVTEAVLSAGSDDLAEAWERLKILRSLWDDGSGERRRDLERAAKVAERTCRIVQSVRGAELPPSVDSAVFKEPAERELWDAWSRIAPQVQEQLGKRRYEEAARTYSTLYPVVHTFFEKVFVMDEDLNVRKNRLALLREIHESLASRFADLSKLPLSGVAPPPASGPKGRLSPKDPPAAGGAGGGVEPS